MNPIDTLTQLFREFPGIGPRQAKRFVYFLLGRPPSYRNDLAQAIRSLESHISACGECFRFYIKKNGAPQCDICSSTGRNRSSLMIVGSDVELETIEKSRSYDGMYFVLGGLIPILDSNPEKRIRERQLIESVKKKVAEGGLKEIILALSANVEGDNTASYLKKIFSAESSASGVAISTLGRGLSTGTELEYSDSDTIKNALKNRSKNSI